MTPPIAFSHRNGVIGVIGVTVREIPKEMGASDDTDDTDDTDDADSRMTIAREPNSALAVGLASSQRSLPPSTGNDGEVAMPTAAAAATSGRDDRRRRSATRPSVGDSKVRDRGVYSPTGETTALRVARGPALSCIAACIEWSGMTRLEGAHRITPSKTLSLQGETLCANGETRCKARIAAVRRRSVARQERRHARGSHPASRLKPRCNHRTKPKSVAAKAHCVSTRRIGLRHKA